MKPWEIFILVLGFVSCAVMLTLALIGIVSIGSGQPDVMKDFWSSLKISTTDRVKSTYEP